MHLYLSSFLLGHDASALPSLVRRPIAVVIGNALDHAADDVRASYIRTSVAELTGLGFSTRELDLRQYFDQPDNIDAALHDAGLVWVNGGNVFLLRRAMQQSGLDRYLITRRGDDDLVYGGFSAGACVAGPTLRGAHLVDAVDATAAGYVETTIWDGLNLVPYCIAPHYKSDHPDAGGVDAMVEYFLENKLPFVALRDCEVMIVP
jgi:dipeptidase E